MKNDKALKNEKVIESYLISEDYNSVIATDLTQNQLEILDERRASFINGSEKGIDWETMHNNIRNNRVNANTNPTISPV